MRLTGTAMLWSGGIGDFIHYLTRWDAACRSTPGPSVLWIESSRPEQLEHLFRLALPEVDVRFVPGHLHWTRTVPLLFAGDPTDGRIRPAYRYVEMQGYRISEDWFLPPSCSRFEPDIARLERVAGCMRVTGHRLVLSLRDKGSLWWPSPESINYLRDRCDDLLGIGSRDEIELQPTLERSYAAADVAEALALSVNANFYVGADTGLATIREFLGLPNVYCVNPGWKERWMTRYGYWPVRTDSRSVFVESAEELRRVLGDGRFNGLNAASTGEVR